MKFYAVLFMFLFFFTALAEQEKIKSEEKVDSTENITNGEIENGSESIEIVQKGAADEKTEEPINYDNIQEEENRSGGDEDTNSTVPQFEQFFDGTVSDDSEEYVKAIPDDGRSVDNEYGKQEDIGIIYEHITQSQIIDGDLGVQEEENDWRSAEGFHDVHKEFSNEDANVDTDERGFSGEDYGDRKLPSIKGRMDTREPRRKEHRPLHIKHYAPHEDGSMLDAMGIRSVSEIMIPRYRPTLTRNGIVYTPTLYTVQTASPHMEIIPAPSWVSNRGQYSREREVYPVPRSRGPHHHHTESKIIDDYSDYGTNTYSYTPAIKRTTQSPLTQAMPSNKFDVYQKLVEASNQPGLSKHPFTDNVFMGNYYSQHQFSDTYRPYDVRRLRRDSWNQRPYPDF